MGDILNKGLGDALQARSGALRAEPASPSQAEPPATIADDVNSIPDNELLGRAVRNCRARHTGKSPRWVGVSDTFSLGNTYSRQLCRKFGVDPDEMVGRRR